MIVYLTFKNRWKEYVVLVDRFMVFLRGIRGMGVLRVYLSIFGGKDILGCIFEICVCGISYVVMYCLTIGYVLIIVSFGDFVVRIL